MATWEARTESAWATAWTGPPSAAVKIHKLPTEGDADELKPFKLNQHHSGVFVLYTVALVLLVLWLLGMVSSHTMGSFIHVLLVVAVVMVLVRVIQGKRLG
jgi:hypothetical protein